MDETASVLTADDRAAMRAFLQRCEVRLSTAHRVATALLSGAGILVLLPALERDSVMQVLRSLLVGPITWSRGLLAVCVVMSIGLALTVFWMLVLELTRFYFHSNHIRTEDGPGTFATRFTLTGLRLPDDELSPATFAAYAASHSSPANVELLIAKNAEVRDRIDRQLAAYPSLGHLVDRATDDASRDLARATAMFELAASRRRSLVEEVTKVEYGIVRHVIRLQVIVLRYVKALLVIVATSLATFAAAAAVHPSGSLTAADQRWIAGVLLVWAPAVMAVVTAPVRWLERLLRADGADRTALGDDVELTQLEDITTRIAGGAWVLAAVAMLTLLIGHDLTTQGLAACLVALVGSLVALAVHLGVSAR
ncbi:MAG: hypothetical protein WEB78_12980 [Ilumatobacteraceae bacterium]